MCIRDSLSVSSSVPAVFSLSILRSVYPVPYSFDSIPRIHRSVKMIHDLIIDKVEYNQTLYDNNFKDEDVYKRQEISL